MCPWVCGHSQLTQEILEYSWMVDIIASQCVFLNLFGGWLLKWHWSSRASLVAKTVKNLPAMQETWVLPLGWEDPLEEGMATHSSILAWKTPCTKEPGRLPTVHGAAKSQTRLSDFTFFFFFAQLLHWFAIFLRTVKSWHFALEAVYNLYRFLSFTHLSIWLLAHSLLHWPSCHSWTITTCTSPQAFVLSVYLLGMRASTTTPTSPSK